MFLDKVLMKRRDFIKQSATAAAASLVLGGGILLIGNRNGNSQKIADIYQPKDYTVSHDPDKPILAAAHSQDHRLAVLSAISLLGGIEHFIGKGDYVCIKPNIGWDRTAEQAANTNPEVVAEIIRLCFKAGARRVVVVDVTCNDPMRTYNRSGIKAAAKTEGAEIIIANNSYFEKVDFGDDSLGKWKVLKPILECDRLINVPVVKHHSLSGMTGAMKNWFGVLTGPRNRLHQDIHGNVAELGRLFQPTLTIEDATRVMYRNGPTGGRLDDVVIYDNVIASTDPVAAEAYVTRYLSKKPSDFPFIARAEQLGLGTSRPPADKIAEISV